ncbi:trypsin-like serine protease [Streptomyces niveiscabiei]|uniref:trypsin-like peptidase domain-containing protein n=1 Tax=Streptomyces niveiscabiei TaxID=164115 RepID=UPI0029A04091|nr:trypsin-like serine protease [Streptomyces niveiscabiei]MDX3387241.1 trypsin-like serine protease [Streptomyces niveiscabiei]
MASPDLPRVAFVRSERGTSSGYLVAPQLVLTAAHCVGEVGDGAEVRVLRPGARQGARQAGPAARFEVAALSDGFRETGVDGFALLRASSADPFGLRTTRPVAWGRLTGTEPLAAETYAFPRGASEARSQNLEHTLGHLIPGSGTVTGPARTGWYQVFQVSTGSFTESALWRGASGAAVFSRGRLLGLIGAYDACEAGRLKVIPVQLLSEQEEFLRLLTEGDARSMVIEPVWKGQEVLEPPYVDLSDSSSAADLLLPQHKLVDFCGREKDLRRLTQWCTTDSAPRPVSLQLVSGDHSVGKTRLARELCARMTGLGWVAGPLNPLATAEDIARLMDLDEDRLIVVDDADGRIGELDALLRHRSDGRKVRVLATTRYESRWWPAFRHRYGELAKKDPYRLLCLDAAEREDIYTKACRAFLRRSAGSEGKPERTADSGLPQPSANLADPDFASCLFVLILAMSDAHSLLHPEWDAQHGTTGPRPLPESLYEQALALEREDWIDHAERACLPKDPVLLDRVVAVSSLAFAGGETRGEQETQAAERLRMVPDLKDASEEYRRRLVRYFQERIDGYGALRPLRPARLAQHLVANTVRDFPELLCEALDVDPTCQPEAGARQALATLRMVSATAFGDDASGRPSDPVVRGALRVAVGRHAAALIRLVRAALETADATTGRSLAAALETVFDRPGDWEGEFAATAARELEEKEPDALLNLAIILRGKAVAFYETQQPPSRETQFRWATENRKLSRVLADAGHRHEAHDPALQAVRQFNALARLDDSYAYLLEKAHSLSNAGVRHLEIGRLSDSLESAREAVRIYETLLHSHPDRSHHRYLSSAQCNLSESLAQTGRCREALQVAADALDLVTTGLPAESPQPPLRPWEIPEAEAFAWRTLARRQADAEKFDDALVSADRALDLYQRLHNSRNGWWERDLARALTVLGRCHGDARHWNESIKFLSQAVEQCAQLEHLYREAERPHHAAALRDLALAHLNKAHALGRGRWKKELDEGLRWAGQACRHHDAMAPEERHAERAHNAWTMGIKAALELALGNSGRARDLAGEALDILEQDTRDDTWKQRRDRIRLTRVHEAALRTDGETDAAMEQLRKADRLRKNLSDAEPGRQLKGLTIPPVPSADGQQSDADDDHSV